MVFVRKGVFVKQSGGDETLADINRIVFFNPGESYRVRHPVPGGDRCTAFSLAPDLVRHCLAGQAGSGGGDTGAFPFRFAAGDPKAILVQQWLRRRLHRGPEDALAVEEICLRLVRRVVEGSRGSHRAPPTRRRGTGAVHRAVAERARQYLAAHAGESLSISSAASATACSPFHLARIFRREVGLTLHRYLNRLRLRNALERLADDPAGLTEIALDHGFSSHGHFTAAFHREFGLTPSAFRLGLKSATLREMSKNLEV